MFDNIFQLSRIRCFKTVRAWALATIVAVGFSGSLIAAEHGEEDPLTREELLAAALAGDPAARTSLAALFGNLQGDGGAIAALAVELIDALEGDPVAITDAALLIADVATETLSTQPIVRVSVDNTFILPKGALGWDLGSPDSPVFKDFKKLTNVDSEMILGSSTGIQRPGGEGLLSDGLVNVSGIHLDVDVPDGSYRLVLLTDDQGNQSFDNPLGEAVTVNGVRTNILNTTPTGWLGNATLGSSGTETFSAIGTGTGGATVIYVEVVDKKLTIDFELAENSNILITGMVLEPAEGPSVLVTEDDIFSDDEEYLFAEATIADAIGGALEGIASAAGDDSQREDVLNLDEPEAEIATAVSPS